MSPRTPRIRGLDTPSEKLFLTSILYHKLDLKKSIKKHLLFTGAFLPFYNFNQPIFATGFVSFDPF